MIREFLYRILCRLAPNEVRARVAAIRTAEGMVTLLVAAADKAGAREAVLAHLLAPDEREVLALLRTPDHWRGHDAEISAEDAKALAGMMAAPLGQKLEVAMQNATVQLAQRACLEKSPNLPYAAGFASGFRACWAVYKSLSVPPDAQGEHQDDPIMRGAGLEHMTTA